MKAAEFNGVYDAVLAAPLVAAGFVRKKSNFFLFHESGILALLRYSNKWSSLTQSTLFTVCLRHKFLRDLEMQSCDEFATLINDYPFKIQPSKMSPDFFRSPWHYEPCNLGHWPKDSIQFGSSKNVSAQIEAIRDAVLSAALEWLKFLTPEEAYRQIAKFGESAYCEKIWLEDYRNFMAVRPPSSL